MSKYKFVKYKDPQNDFDVSKVIMTVDTPAITELLEEFENFIKACGYSKSIVLSYEEEETKNEQD